jgi:hypothetical protein
VNRTSAKNRSRRTVSEASVFGRNFNATGWPSFAGLAGPSGVDLEIPCC